jgi:hypothetical protein
MNYKKALVIGIASIIIALYSYFRYNNQITIDDPSLYSLQPTIDRTVLSNYNNLVEDSITNWKEISESIRKNISQYPSLDVVKADEESIRIVKGGLLSKEISSYKLKSFQELVGSESMLVYDSNEQIINSSQFECRDELNFLLLKSDLVHLPVNNPLPSDGIFILISEDGTIRIRDLENHSISFSDDIKKIIDDWKRKYNCNFKNYNIIIFLDFTKSIPPLEDRDGNR